MVLFSRRPVYLPLALRTVICHHFSRSYIISNRLRFRPWSFRWVFHALCGRPETFKLSFLFSTPLQLIVSLIMLFTSNIFALINYFSQILWLSVVASIAALLWLRRTQPDLPRPIRVNLIIPVIFIILCVILVLLPSIQEPMNLIVGFLVTLSGVPVYYACIKWKSKPAAIGRFSKSIETFCQIIFNAVFVDEVEKAVWIARRTSHATFIVNFSNIPNMPTLAQCSSSFHFIHKSVLFAKSFPWVQQLWIVLG